MGVLNPERAGEAQQRGVVELCPPVIDLVVVAGEQERAVDLVVMVIGIGQPQPGMIQAGQQAVVIGANIDALAAQVDIGGVRVVLPFERVAQFRRAMQVDAVKVAQRVTMRVAGQTVSAVLPGIGCAEITTRRNPRCADAVLDAVAKESRSSSVP